MTGSEAAAEVSEPRHHRDSRQHAIVEDQAPGGRIAADAVTIKELLVQRLGWPVKLVRWRTARSVRSLLESIDCRTCSSSGLMGQDRCRVVRMQPERKRRRALFRPSTSSPVRPRCPPNFARQPIAIGAGVGSFIFRQWAFEWQQIQDSVPAPYWTIPIILVTSPRAAQVAAS